MFEKRKESIDTPPQPKRAEPDTRPFKTEPGPRAMATIGNTICIEGSISGSENLVINGTVKGTVTLVDHDVTIGETGKVSADLIGKSVRVDGEVSGDIEGSEIVIVSKSGQVRGNITAPRVTLEDGANFKGSIDMDPVKREPKPQATRTKETAPGNSELLTADSGTR